MLKADSVGLPIEGQQVTQILAKSFIEEALIISDLFDLNEYAAVELLLAGKNILFVTCLRDTLDWFT